MIYGEERRRRRRRRRSLLIQEVVEEESLGFRCRVGFMVKALACAAELVGQLVRDLVE